MELSIVIINHNTNEMTTQTVEYILQSEIKAAYEIIIVDNSSPENEVLEIMDSHVKILRNVENKGFGNACNIGAARALGAYVLFLNSDTVMQKRTIDTSLRFMKQNPSAGCLGVKMVLADGSLDKGCKRGFPTPWNAFCYFGKLHRIFKGVRLFNGYHLGHLDENEIHEVGSVSGAYMLMPKKLFEELKGFDERFFMYGEDLDLCYRVKQRGYRVVYFPVVSCIHLKGKSVTESNNSFLKYHFYYSMELYYQKHYIKKYPWLLNKLILGVIRWKYPKEYR